MKLGVKGQRAGTAGVDISSAAEVPFFTNPIWKSLTPISSSVLLKEESRHQVETPNRVKLRMMLIIFEKLGISNPQFII